MEIFAVANSKGGCGKTTTSIHIADLIAQKKFSVLLVDFDPQGHSTMTFVKEPQAIKHNIGDALLDEKPTSLRQACIKINDYLTLLPSGISLASLEQSLHGKKNREFYLREKLRELAGNFDFVIIDCPPQLGLLTINAFLAAEKVIIPLDTSVFAMRGVEQTLDIFNLLSNKLKHKIEYRILLTNFISQTKYSQEVFGDIKKKYPQRYLRGSRSLILCLVGV
jgi:chromosome partitioning protein